MLYAALKGDLVGSRSLENRDEVQGILLQLIEQANIHFTQEIKSEFIVTHGDEFQGLLTIKGAQLLPDIYHFLSLGFGPIKFRLGMGVGEIQTAIQPKAIGMDGPAWHRAKQAIDLAAAKKAAITVELPSAFLTRQANLLLAIMDDIRRHWNPGHLESVNFAREGLTQQDIAERLGITQSALSLRLKNARWKRYLDLETVTKELLAASEYSVIKPFDS